MPGTDGYLSPHEPTNTCDPAYKCPSGKTCTDSSYTAFSQKTRSLDIRDRTPVPKKNTPHRLGTSSFKRETNEGGSSHCSDFTVQPSLHHRSRRRLRASRYTGFKNNYPTNDIHTTSKATRKQARWLSQGQTAIPEDLRLSLQTAGITRRTNNPPSQTCDRCLFLRCPEQAIGTRLPCQTECRPLRLRENRRSDISNSQPDCKTLWGPRRLSRLSQDVSPIRAQVRQASKDTRRYISKTGTTHSTGRKTRLRGPLRSIFGERIAPACAAGLRQDGQASQSGPGTHDGRGRCATEVVSVTGRYTQTAREEEKWDRRREKGSRDPHTLLVVVPGFKANSIVAGGGRLRTQLVVHALILRGRKRGCYTHMMCNEHFLTLGDGQKDGGWGSRLGSRGLCGSVVVLYHARGKSLCVWAGRLPACHCGRRRKRC